MARPAEYEGLLKIGSFKEAASDRNSIAQFLEAADQMAAAAAATTQDLARFHLAYEGMFNLVMAVLEHYGVRPGDAGGHRVTAIQRVAGDLKLAVAKQSALSRLHDLRNRVTYRASIPPITKADADAMQIILGDMLLAARAVIATPP